MFAFPLGHTCVSISLVWSRFCKGWKEDFIALVFWSGNFPEPAIECGRAIAFWVCWLHHHQMVKLLLFFVFFIFLCYQWFGMIWFEHFHTCSGKYLRGKKALVISWCVRQNSTRNYCKSSVLSSSIPVS